MVTRHFRCQCIGAGLLAATLLALSPAASAQIEMGTIQGTANWVLPTLDAAGNLQFDAAGNVIGTACPQDWQANYTLDFDTCIETLTQTFCLTVAAGSAALTNADLMRWETRMESVWSTDLVQILCASSTGSKTWHLRYDAVLEIGGTGSMFDVVVHDGDGPTNTADWYRGPTSGTGVDNPNFDVVAHETGHYLANPDEYKQGCVDPQGANVADAFTTNSLMNNTRHGAWEYKARHFHLWELALVTADTAASRTGLSYSTFVVPEPGGFSLWAAAFPGVVLLLRRRRGSRRSSAHRVIGENGIAC